MDKPKRIVGGLFGVAVGARISNTHVSGEITVDGKVEDIAVGGLVGFGQDVEIINSSSDMRIKVSEDGEFDKLKERIQQLEADADTRTLLMRQTVELQESRGEPARFIPAYKCFVSLAADHMTILGPFLPFLARFMG